MEVVVRRFVTSVTLLVMLGAIAHAADVTLLNVSYDPTRELWREINANFLRLYEKETGVKVTIKQSHGGSSTQARAIIDGLDADVVTLASYLDDDAISKKGLMRSDWVDRLPNRSLPYTSTVVFVVRKGNPKQIKDWKGALNRLATLSCLPTKAEGGANGKH
jgi:sulfate/thiosulfate transport system substrate-binding protein